MAQMKSGWMVVVVIVLIVIAGWYSYMKIYPPQSSTTQSTSATPTTAVKGEVIIRNNTFIPDTMTVKVGDMVTWVNEETYGHDVKSDNGIFQSPKMATGEKYSYAFLKEGTYTYICSIHPFMHAKIIVIK
jgi:plastocyanin